MLSYRIVIARRLLSSVTIPSRVSAYLAPCAGSLVAMVGGRIYDVGSRCISMIVIVPMDLTPKQHVHLQAHRAQDRDSITGRVRHGRR